MRFEVVRHSSVALESLVVEVAAAEVADLSPCSDPLAAEVVVPYPLQQWN